MKANTSAATNNTLKQSGSATAVKTRRVASKEPIPGNGPWMNVDGVWYTKDVAGELVPMKS